MFTIFVVIVHIVVCVALILIILLQSGKGADIGAVFGGGSSQTVFGSGGASTFLSKVTIGAAVTFMVTSIILTYFSGRITTQVESSVMKSGTVPISLPEEKPPASDQAPAATAPETPPVAVPGGKPDSASPGGSGDTGPAKTGEPAAQGSGEADKGSDSDKRGGESEEPR